MAWAYILECADGSIYVGSTVDLDRRISEPNDGLGAAKRGDRTDARSSWSGRLRTRRRGVRLREDGVGVEPQEEIALIEGRWEDLTALASQGVAAPQGDLGATCTSSGG